MSSKLNTTQAAKQHAHNCSTAQHENTWHHIKQLESAEYLAMLENKKDHHASCKNCAHHTTQKYTSQCKLLNKLIQPYNICTKWRIVQPTLLSQTEGT